MTPTFLYFFFNTVFIKAEEAVLPSGAASFSQNFFSLSLGIQYTLYMDAKFHKRDAVAIYKQLYKGQFQLFDTQLYQDRIQICENNCSTRVLGKLDKNILPDEFCRKYFFIETYIMVAMVAMVALVALVALSKIIIN